MREIYNRLKRLEKKVKSPKKDGGENETRDSS